VIIKILKVIKEKDRNVLISLKNSPQGGLPGAVSRTLEEK